MLNEIRSILLELASSDLDADAMRRECARLAQGLIAKSETKEADKPSLDEYTRAIISHICVTDSDLETFIIFDNYPVLKRLFTSGIDHQQKITALLKQIGAPALLAELLQGRRSQARKILNNVCIAADDFNSLVRGFFPSVYRLFADEMNMAHRENLLLQCVSMGEVAEACHRHNGELAMKYAYLWK